MDVSASGPERIKEAGSCHEGRPRGVGTPRFRAEIELLWRSDSNMQSGSTTIT